MLEFGFCIVTQLEKLYLVYLDHAVGADLLPVLQAQGLLAYRVPQCVTLEICRRQVFDLLS